MVAMDSFYPPSQKNSTTPVKPIKGNLMKMVGGRAQVSMNLLKGLYIWGSGWTITTMARGSLSILIIKGMKGKWFMAEDKVKEPFIF